MIFDIAILVAQGLFDAWLLTHLPAPGGTLQDEGDKSKGSIYTNICVFEAEESHEGLRAFLQVLYFITLRITTRCYCFQCSYVIGINANVIQQLRFILIANIILRYSTSCYGVICT